MTVQVVLFALGSFEEGVCPSDLGLGCGLRSLTSNTVRLLRLSQYEFRYALEHNTLYEKWRRGTLPKHMQNSLESVKNGQVLCSVFPSLLPNLMHEKRYRVAVTSTATSTASKGLQELQGGTPIRMLSGNKTETRKQQHHRRACGSRSRFTCKRKKERTQEKALFSPELAVKERRKETRSDIYALP